MKKYDGVLKRVRELEYKKGIKYAKPDGTLYKTLKVLYTVAWAYTLFINTIILLGSFMNLENMQNSAPLKIRIATVSVITGLMVIGYILNCFKLYIVSAVTSALPTVFSILYFWNILQDDFGGVKIAYYWRHLAPLTLMLVFMVWLTVLAVRAKVLTDRMYKKVSENLYKNYNVGEEPSEEEWNEFLANYDHEEYKKQFIQ